MTATRPPARLTSIVERVTCLLAWGCQASTAAVYLSIMFEPAVWRDMLGKSPVSAISAWTVVGSTALLWMICLWGEQKHFYNRPMQRFHRKVGLLGHATVLIFAAAAAAEHPSRIAVWIVLGIFAPMSAAVWHAWMETLFLPPEDQAVIDAITAREAQKSAALYDASVKERRRARLNEIVTGLGYELADVATTPSAEEAEAPLLRWKLPARKHEPLVYFVRNGNRIKIGTTTELKRRIRTLALRPENVVLLLVGGRQREHELHRQFADLRIGNTEWFAYDGPLADYVHAECARAARKEQPK